MGSYEDDDLALPLPEDGPSPSAPPAQRKLRRLRRASSSAEAPVAMDLQEAQKALDPERSVSLPTIEPEQEEFDEKIAVDLDPLFADPAQSDGWGTRHTCRKREEAEEVLDSGREGKKTAKKRLSLEEGEESAKKKRRKSSKLVGDDGKHKESARENRRLEKERNAHLDLLHSETQRLLRETRNASFKPVPLVPKPISSVLERIRRRKLEVLKSFGHSCASLSSTDVECQTGEITWNSNLSQSQNDGGENREATRVESDVHLAYEGGCNEASDGEDFQNAFQSAINDTKELDSGDTNENTVDNFKDSLVSCLPTTSSKHDVADDSSAEEESDKENIDPQPYKTVNMNSYEEGSLVKDFLDDEAEEEDDSDHDLMRFEEDEEGDESDENEVLKDLIATGYKEAQTDQEKRNQLHQKWLEQQDAAATENVLQRLQCGLLHAGEDDDEACEDLGDRTLHDQLPSEMTRKNSRKAKQMIAHIFTDGNDAYIPSDDEETDHALIRQRFLRQNVLLDTAAIYKK